MALALSLRDAGVEDVDVYESTSTVNELGVGINVLPHAVRELTELGLLDDLYAIGIPTAELVYYSRHGQRIWGEPRGLAAGYRWPQLSVHRGELLGVLYRVVLERLGPERVHTGHHLVRFGQEEGGPVWGEFVDRATNASVGRVTVGEPFLSGRTMIMAGHFRRRMVIYPISKRHEDQGRALINWVAELKTADDQPMQAGLGAHRPPRGRARAVRLVCLRLPRRAGFDPRRRGHLPVPDGGPRPAADVGLRAGHAPGGRRAPHVSRGVERGSQAILDARILARELAL